MDSRAKQRLTGAVILVALFVLLVPELLTGPRHATDPAPGEEGMRRYTIDLDAPAGGSQPTAPAESDSAVSLPPVAEHAAHADDPRAVPGEAAQPATAAPAPAPVAASPRATPPAAAAAPATPPSAPRPAASAAPAPARADTPRPAPAPAATARGAFAVQLGSFVSKENADRLAREMTAKGFNAFVAPPVMTNGRALYRVRVGPTRDRASAEALAAQLRRVGQVGSIVSIS
jgi:DedD protein